MAKYSFEGEAIDYAPDCAVIHVISDSLGETASSVVTAAAAQFPLGSVRIRRLPKLQALRQVREYFDSLDPQSAEHPSAVFHTIVDPDLRREVRRELDEREIPSVDLLGPGIAILSSLTGKEPAGIPGINHEADDRYFRRIDAMEFFVEHDDGRNPQDLPKADIVLIGVSRTSKTPLSMYLAFMGYKVANVPLALGVEPPIELEDVDPARIFGLMSTTDTLVSIRTRRLSKDGASDYAASYADPAEVVAEQAEARRLMRHLGCMIINPSGKAVEETANEIIAQIEELKRIRAEYAARERGSQGSE